jgi:hypothetical protein
MANTKGPSNCMRRWPTDLDNPSAARVVGLVAEDNEHNPTRPTASQERVDLK